MIDFQKLIGQDQAREFLQQAIAVNRVAPAYLFAGSAGVGRALAAKCFAQLLLSVHLPPENQLLTQQKALMGNHPDLLWVEPTYQHQGQLLKAKEAEEAGLKRKAPPQIRIEQIREISQFLSRPPLEAPRSVVIVEEAQSMTEAAANALLKTLEEPGKATLILIAPSAEDLLPTLVSRCQRIPFYRLSDKDMSKVLHKEGYQDILKHSILMGIAQGSPGEAIVAYTQLQSFSQELISRLSEFPKTPFEGLELAKVISQEIDTQGQLWLVDYLQYSYWEKQKQKKVLEQLEKTRQGLLSYVQPRLVWECTFLALVKMK